MGRQLLIDTILWRSQSFPSLMVESITKSGKMIVTGILQSADKKNQNGRVYPKNILKEQVDRYMQLVKERAAHGELDHPESSVVNLRNIAHTIVEIGWDGDNVIGACEILDNQPAGKCLRGLFESKLKVGISSRGVGSVEEVNEGDTVEVQPDYEIICWDFVSNPSTIGAWMSPLGETRLIESANHKQVKEWKWGKANGIISDIICEIGTYCNCD